MKRKYIRILLVLLVFFLIRLFSRIAIFSRYLTFNSISNSFQLIGNDDITLEYGDFYNDEGYISKEPNKVIVINNVDYHSIGDYEIQYIFKDNGFKKILTRKIHIVDTTKPTLELVKCDSVQYLALKGKVKHCNYKVFDNYDKDVKVKIESNINNKKKGTYTTKYTATDSNGNTTTKTVTTYVKNKKDVNYIKISISKQRLYYYRNKKLVFTTLVTTGKHNATRTGNFKVWVKKRNVVLKGKDYESKVTYWMAYDGNNFGIHDASWRNNFGNKNFYYNGSHGCVNVPTKKMKQLFSMVETGTPVYIRK